MFNKIEETVCKIDKRKENVTRRVESTKNKNGNKMHTLELLKYAN